MSPYIRKHAILSADGQYRYMLDREWRGTHKHENWKWLTDSRGKIAVDGIGSDLGEPKPCVFIMLNPSTADADKDDPTIRKCVGFAKQWKFERLTVLNLFAFRATDPKVLLSMDDRRGGIDPVGFRNQEHVEEICTDAGRIVCAWGAHGDHLQQNETMLGWLFGFNLHCLGLTKHGHPKHPLYVPYETPLQEYIPRSCSRG
jgi:hypothetical protein